MNANDPAPLLNVPNLEAGMSYLGRLPLANPVAAEEQLIQLLDTLLATPPDPADLILLLEQCRVPLCFVEEEMARRYHNKPIVLAELEENAFQQVVAAWRRMARAYALCARLTEPDTASPEYAVRMATILHRCLYYTGMIILEHYRARRELPPGIWLDVHGYYETAEEWGVAMTPVDDTLESDRQTTHCMAAYVTLLLIDQASPYSHSVRDLNLIRRWATLWAPLAGVLPVADDVHVPPYVVELMKDAGLHPANPAEPSGADSRRLDTVRLARQIGQMLSQLKQRVQPSQLGLGEETGSHVAQLLEQLSKPWTQQASPRRFRRFPSAGTAKVCAGFPAMHYAVCGAEFVQPEAARAYSRSEFDTLFTFRDRADPQQPLSIREKVNFPMDDWEVINHSANGFRLARSAAGQKMAHGQLIALCPHDGESFILAQASWLMQDQEGGLVAGVAVLPGLPTGVAARAEGMASAPGEQYVRAFLLPPVPAIGEAGSLVFPPGMYMGSRQVDIQGDGHWRVRLKSVLQRGPDFERVSFEVV